MPSIKHWIREVFTVYGWLIHSLIESCSISKLSGLTIRLLGGSSYNEGRVEVNYNSEWGTVCDDGWDDTDASVVCRQLGFGSSGTAMGSASFGQGSGPIWLSSIKCSGSEPSIINCVHLGVNITSSCSHLEDAGVICDKQNGRVYNVSLHHIATQ